MLVSSFLSIIQMSQLQAAKKALRTELKQKIKNISLEEKCRQSKIVFEKLLQNERFQDSQRISVYLSRDIEISTDTILKQILDSQKECFIPKYDSTKPLMEMVKLHSLNDYENLPLTKWNIKQPAEDDSLREDAVLTGGLDLMIVPGIGFTEQGHRIGNGKGYYDIYMKNYEQKFKKPVYTIALAFKEQVVASIPVSEHDVLINEVIFPS